MQAEKYSVKILCSPFVIAIFELIHISFACFVNKTFIFISKIIKDLSQSWRNRTVRYHKYDFHYKSILILSPRAGRQGAALRFKQCLKLEEKEENDNNTGFFLPYLLHSKVKFEFFFYYSI